MGMIKIKHKIDMMRAISSVTYKEWSAYRTHSMVSIFVGPVYFIVQYFIWTGIYNNQSSLNGMNLEQMLMYYGAITMIEYLIMDFADWNLQMLIRTGKYMTFLLRPINHMFFALSQKLGHRVIGLFFEFIPCFCIFQFIFRVNMIPEHIGWTILSVIFSFFINFFVNYSIGMAAFWLVGSSGIRSVIQMISALFSGTIIPLTFFPEHMQRISFFLPFQYILYVPSMVFSGSYQLAGIRMSIPEIVMLQGIVLCITFAFSWFLYRISLKKYCAVDC